MLKFLFIFIFSFFLFSSCTILKSEDSYNTENNLNQNLEDDAYEDDAYEDSVDYTEDRDSGTVSSSDEKHQEVVDSEYKEGDKEFADYEEYGEGDEEFADYEEYEETSEEYEETSEEYAVSDKEENLQEPIDSGYEQEDNEEFVDYSEDTPPDQEVEKKDGVGGFFSRLFKQSDSEDGEDIYQDEEYSNLEKEDIIKEESGYIRSEESNMSSSSDTDQEKNIENIEVKKQIKKNISLNKIIKRPYKKSNFLVNAVYIARSKDTIENISQKIYGSNKVSELYVINPHLKSRSVKVGDKIYYNSPNRPEDSSQLLFYYEDLNIPSLSYMLSPGDNIRNISSNLLGHVNSWKEIWATNPEIKSKGYISEAFNIVYWPNEQYKAQPTEVVSEVPSESQSKDVSEPETISDSLESTPDIEPISETIEKEELSESENLSKKTPNLIQMIIDQKQLSLALLVVILILILMIRLILKKKRQRDFDYTSTNIEI